MRSRTQIPIIHYSLVIIMLLFLHSCANIVAPTGGQKDIEPPKVLQTEPENASTNFSGNTIRLYFDEYVQLKDERRVMLISPPPDELPEARIKGKSVILTIPGKLKESTTYSIQFGTSIQDFNEGNPLGNYNYVFSTGNSLDTLSISGTVLKADNMTGVAKVMVFLYSSSDDSVIFKEKPRYLARTDDNGNFRINYIAGGAYKLIALKDDNSDLLASLPAEEIAFPDSLIWPEYYPMAQDTIVKDSLQLHKPALKDLSLFLFKQKDSTLRFSKAYLEKPYQLILPFSVPVNDVIIKPSGSSSDLSGAWYLPEWSKNHDTLICWISPDLSADSLNFSFETDKSLKDTVNLDLRRYGKGGKYRKDKDKPEKTFAYPGWSGSITPDEVLLLKFKYPLKDAKLDEIKLLTPKDTFGVKMVFTDSIKRTLSLSYSWQEKIQYQLIIPKGAIRDWTGETNDSLVYKFSTRTLQDYGSLVFIFQPEESGQYILQLLDSKDNVVKEFLTTTYCSWKLNYLIPGKYRIKVIRDKNNNSHWDSGNYHLKIQPEKISFYPKTLEIRGNWDLEEKWKW
ncbi:MAG: Ig-like domain-containing protein [Bacteroidales bacterium]